MMDEHSEATPLDDPSPCGENQQLCSLKIIALSGTVVEEVRSSDMDF